MIPADFDAEAGPVVVLSSKVWRTVFRSDSGVLGKTVTLGDVRATVIGVLPSWFALPQWTPVAGTDVWMPLNALPAGDRAALMQRDFHADSRVFGRLDRNIGLARARVAMNGVAANLAVAYPQTSRRFDRVDFVPLRDMIVGNIGPRLYSLAAAVFLVLLICCVNLANLFMSRTTSRTREFAIRTALGAGRRRLFRQLLTESLVLGVLGGLIGTVTAMALVTVIRNRMPGALPRFAEVGVDFRVVGVAALIIGMTAVLLAIFSMQQIVVKDISQPLKRSSGTRGVLVAVQVALSMILLVGAGLLTKSLIRLSVVVAGFDEDRLVAVWLYPRFPKYDGAREVVTLYQQITANVVALPGVTGVGIINHAPFGGGGIPSRASRHGDPRTASAETSVWFRTISTGYFSTMGIPILAGRDFSEVDMTAAPGPIIVNATFARQWGAESPIGSQLTVLKAAKERPDFGEPLTGTVVGVVGDVKHFGLDVDAAPAVYVPYTHNPWAHSFLVARTASQPELLLEAIETAVRTAEPNLPLDGLGMGASTMTSRMGSSLMTRRLNTLLVGGFAIAALCLAMIGMYGVTAYSVVAERREIGIKLALGAPAAAITKGVVTRYLLSTSIGLMAGLAGAFALSRVMTSLLFDVQLHDPLTFVGVAVALLGATGLASYLPARRAATIDPVATLKAG